jgi:ssDNA thymidine ADP-ribosyltransferase DarT-like protein
VVHLVSSVELATKLGQPWAFTEGHADMAFTKFFGDLKHMDQIDWEVMGQTFWNDTAEQPDRKRRRQAEFLIHKSFPWDKITEIGVMTPQMKVQCEQALAGATHRPTVKVMRLWYY